MSDKMIKKGNIVMKTKSIMTLAAMALMMAACTSEDLTQPQTTQPGAGGSKGIPFTATISGKAATRAIKENTTDGILETSWAKGEKVALMHGGIVDVMEVTEVGTDGSATISGTITGSPADGDKVSLFYPASVVDVSGESPVVQSPEQLLAEQDGKLETIAEKYDYRMKDGATLKVVLGSATLDGTVSLENQLAIVRFSLSDGTSALEAESFEIDDNSGQPIITVTPSSADNVFYVAMPPATTAQAFHFIAKKGNEEYFYSQPSATLAAGKYYYQNMTLKDMLNTPLTLEATADDTKITAQCGYEIAFQYAINGGTKIDVYSESGGESFNIELEAGEFVEFYSKRYNVGDTRLHIFPDKETYVYGNVMSLIDDSGQGFANDKEVGYDALSSLFFNAEKLVFHPKKRIVLPAITLDNKCYQSMFSGCTGLTELPADLLPATTLAADCYHSMFSGCTGLTSLPEKLLPATTLKTGCYDSMFRGCTGLETLPADLLPATTLAMNCYKEMFHGCTGLTVAPDLPAPKLEEGCYSTMFFGCTKLSSVKCLATTGVSWSALNNWLTGAGTADGCERKLYVDPLTNFSDNDWGLDSSGEDGKRWGTAK
jgi:hypothetical protein